MRSFLFVAALLLSLNLPRAYAVCGGCSNHRYPSPWELGLPSSIKLAPDASGEACASRMIHRELTREEHGKFKDLVVDVIVRSPDEYTQDRFVYYAHDNAQNQFSGVIFSEMRDDYLENERSGNRTYYKTCVVLGKNTGFNTIAAEFSLLNSQGTEILSGD